MSSPIAYRAPKLTAITAVVLTVLFVIEAQVYTALDFPAWLAWVGLITIIGAGVSIVAAIVLNALVLIARVHAWRQNRRYG
jgi:uncharacterized integral membrane protein